MQIVEDLCHMCKYFDMGDHECKKGQYIRDIGMYEVVSECEDYCYWPETEEMNE